MISKEDYEDYDSAILLLIKDDLIDVRCTEGLGDAEMLELLAAAALSLNNLIKSKYAKTSTAIH